MEVLIIIGIIVVIASCLGISALIKNLRDGKKVRAELKEARSEFLSLKREYDSAKAAHTNELQTLERELRRKIEQQGNIIHDVKQEFERTKQCYETTVRQKDQMFERIKEKNNESLEYISSLIADHLTLQYEISANFLKTKKNPAHKEAQGIRQLKEESKEIVQRNKILQYKYEFLFQLFPDLELYVDDIDSINELSNCKNLEDLADATDRVRHYVSREEYDRLSENERNQLALDRYVQSQKTKWQIGRDYELFIGYEYAKNGWNVEYFGIEKQLEDMGRDLIATKDNEIHIIQCKYWAQEKLIHEKHIAQLYGTTVQYTLSSLSAKRIVPVFATNISVSDTARSFSKYLNVTLIENKPMTDFPRIKCNINQDEFGLKTYIYHLPMDQQYDRTKIYKEGEFFAFTVQEAVDAGFRRAWKWYGNG